MKKIKENIDLKELEEERRRIRDSLQRARETRERYYQEYYATHRYDFDILECEFQRLKAKETSMLVDLNKYIYGGDTIKETNYFCPNCYSKIKKEHFFALLADNVCYGQIYTI